MHAVAEDVQLGKAAEVVLGCSVAVTVESAAGEVVGTVLGLENFDLVETAACGSFEVAGSVRGNWKHEGLLSDVHLPSCI